MGHRNSSSHIHDAHGFCSNGGRAARLAAGASTLKGSEVTEAVETGTAGVSRRETSTAKAGFVPRLVMPLLKPRPPITAEKAATSKKTWARRAAAWLLLAGIRFYQAVFAPMMPVGCKFYPSCSHYAAEAIARHGAVRGVWLAAARLWRCRPFTKGGFDPVPDAVADMSELFGHGLRNVAGNRARNEVGS